MRLRRIHKTIILVIYCLSVPLFSQQEGKSKAFKSKSSPFRIVEVRPSDVTYQLWEGFQLMRSASAGDAASQHELSIRYLTGKGFPFDTVKAAMWMKKSADQGFLLATFNYGIFLNNGWGTDWDPFAAFRYFRTAAEREMREGEYVLGLFYTDNLAVPRDYPTAYDWIKRASEKGYEPAEEVLNEFEKRGITGKIQRDSTSAVAVSTPSATSASIPAAAIQPVLLDFQEEKGTEADDLTLLKELFNEGNEKLRVTLGLSKILADSVQTDSTGLSLIRAAAEGGNPEAMTVVGRCYERGIGVPKDRLQAAVYYIRAIRLDSRRAPALLWRLVNEKNVMTEIQRQVGKKDPKAYYVISSLAALGFSATVTDEQALQYLQLAVSATFIPAVIDLGSYYSSGQWVKQDKKRAVEFWRFAAEKGSTEGKIRIAVAEVFDGTVIDARTAFETVRRFADEGSVLAQTALGYCYEKGILVPVNISQALYYYRKSAQRGNQSALSALARMYDEKRPKEKEFQIENE